MKKLLLLSLGTAVAVSGFAQAQRVYNHTAKQVNVISSSPNNNVAAKTTGIGDTLALTNISSNDTLTLYKAGVSDSGYVTGTDGYGDMGDAERYDINGADSSVTVIGVISTFGGTVNPASTKTVNFKVWSVGAQVQAPFGDPNILESGFPNTVLTSMMEFYTHLGVPDTEKAFLFTTPTAALSTSFFIGFELNYTYPTLNGDTIGLISTISGERNSPLYTVSGTDTIINNQNVTEYNDGSGWHDDATDNFQVYNDLAIYPIVIIGNPTLGVAGVTKNNLTFYGNYPNPAINNTNIKFSLNNAADVTVQITDMTGRVINTIKQSNLGAGEHIIPVQTGSLASGNYLYLIHTSNGDGMASKFTVAK